ncbi:MAG: capsule assembly Wzi family protein [Bacteroidaceae bacterium]|nr:capsule assembly Wzi family protein [Bacteroidaceae bacterium]
MKRTLSLILTVLTFYNTFAQDLGKGINYFTELRGTTSNGDYTPFWFSANKYGLSSIDTNSGYIRGGLFRSTEIDSIRKWKYGYGIDIAVPSNYTSKFVLHQIYGEMDYLKGRLTIGAKEQPLEMKNAELSSGDLTYSINSRPIPQIRLELKDYWTLPIFKGFVSFKGHISYGWYTDGNWQKDFTNSSHSVYSKGSKFHSKAGYIKLGQESKFPITFTAGVHFCAQFGGESWNVGKRADDTSDFNGSHVTNKNDLSSYWHAFFPGGSDASDAGYDNAEGNILGSYQANIKYHGNNWALKLYGEHFFEDHSQMFLQYDWKDFLIGVEANFPKNPFVTSFVYEHIGTLDQSGCVYHDKKANLPIQISGTDDYYNHNIYGSWQHWGQAIGNPLLLSPIYNEKGVLRFMYNRITAHHIGICGDPTSEFHYRMLVSHIRTLGTYSTPTNDPIHSNYFLGEITYQPQKIQGVSITASFGTNGGELIGTSQGGMLTISKTGVLTK